MKEEDGQNNNNNTNNNNETIIQAYNDRIQAWLQTTQMFTSQGSIACSKRYPRNNWVRRWCTCSEHSASQASFLMQLSPAQRMQLQQQQPQHKAITTNSSSTTGTVTDANATNATTKMTTIPDRKIRFLPHLAVLGDLSELRDLLSLVGWNNNNNTKNKRTKQRKNMIGRDSTGYPTRAYFPRRKDWFTNDTWWALCQFHALDYFLYDFPWPQACQKQQQKTTTSNNKN